MVTQAIIWATLASGALPLGVVQQGVCEVRTATSAVQAQVGHVLDTEARLSTNAVQWVEVSLSGGLRARLFAGSALNLGSSKHNLQMAEGRLWLQKDGSHVEPLTVEMPSAQVKVPPQTSVVIEHTRSGGTLVVVRAGEVVVQSGLQKFSVGPGQALTHSPGAQGLRAPRVGGQALSELVAQQTRLVLGDPSRVYSFVLARAQGLGDARPGAVDLNGWVRGSAAALGAEGDMSSVLVEEGLRPPPFFEQEVPTKGPNLEVQVNFQ